ncbi:cobyrinic acid a,c-diamide synthase [[Phormidium ambiguum] IAM M-71]|uniref:Cobyrinate a,c-diamide synthase n=1 Tax=[Phormidium ambiguum] IAM M-71 TaxID=454136 RepID=A0A1U7I6B1_9CYAN|nr:cobyrinate a,c-diamide synthase [Phormidium ambiguum]OKH31794.1 cobyrinic acid a,c-diamide synthase [Phormidium ambiguum IAM M-71]
MSLIIAGERSGVGKTTVTLALLATLKHRYLTVQSFKVGPDYIDPMFHHYVTGKPCRNLDPILTSATYVKECFSRHIQGVEFALVEGVMGLFDGVRMTGNDRQDDRQDACPTGLGTGDFASTAHIARLLDLPVLLVIDCSRLSGSVAAIVHGFSTFDPRIKIAGLVLNRVGSDRHLELLKDALLPLNLPILGVLRREDDIAIPDRHLGLIPTAELPQMDAVIKKLAHLGETCFNWEKLLPMLKSQVGQARCLSSCLSSPVRIAIAQDKAFNFYYQDNLDLLEQLGAELLFWSPINNTTLPKDVKGFYFGGGFPEVFAQELSENFPIRQAVKQAILSGTPTYAECGGLMYLCEEIIDFSGNSYPMLGILPTKAEMGSRLTLGYRQATTLQDSPILPTSATVWGHEFHRSSLSKTPTKPLFKIKGFSANLVNEEGWNLYNIHASYIHLHFGDRPEIPTRFLQQCRLNCI